MHFLGATAAPVPLGDGTGGGNHCLVTINNISRANGRFEFSSQLKGGFDSLRQSVEPIQLVRIISG
ncbi:Endonuclease [Anopheles sinensis]|uniref:Endonuclease n=1 Tax=Anopheles sinensis TaxID=74873 RepID=A0A084WS77_ANOSI|nr:Endonuclease [Anopheles sinensis]